MQVPEDGSVNPVDLCMAYAKGARNLGVEIVEGARVARLIAESGRAVGVMTEDGSVIRIAPRCSCDRRLVAGAGG